MDIAQKVIEIIEREQHLKPGTVTIDSDFAELGIDSLDGANILFAAQEEFKIDFPDSIAPHELRNVRRVVETLTDSLQGEKISGSVTLAEDEAASVI